MYNIEKEQVAKVAVNAGIALSMLIFLPLSIWCFILGAGFIPASFVFLTGFCLLVWTLTYWKIKSWTKLLGRFYGKYFSVVEG